MNYGKLFAVLQIIVSASAAVGYVYSRDWRHVIYWVSATALTASVTF